MAKKRTHRKQRGPAKGTQPTPATAKTDDAARDRDAVDNRREASAAEATRDDAHAPAPKPARDAAAAKRDSKRADATRADAKRADAKRDDGKRADATRADAASAKRAGATKRADAKASAPVPEPAFFFGYEVAWAKLLVARVVLFGLLAIDSLLQISHAPRYGAGGFNVAQLPGLDALGAGRVGFGVGHLLCSSFLVLAACGVATRVVIPLAAAIYAWLYFGSQLDSYQHHYLVSLFLLLACFVPWQRPAEATPRTPVRTWAVRLILIQLGILYLWAAISKMSPAWLDGTTMTKQITGPARSLIEDTIGFKRAANLTLITELVLAFAIWIRPAWRVALPLGVGFHAMILYSGLEIGLFAWLMLGFYLLVVPDRVYVWIAERLPVPRVSWPSPMVAAGAGVACLVLASMLAGLVRFPDAHVVALVLGAVVVPVIAVIGRRDVKTALGAAGLAHLLAIGTWLAVDRATDQAVDYYRFWGGSARRLGDVATSERAYRRLTEIDPGSPNGHFRLGQLLLGRGEEAGGLAALQAAQRLEPTKARAFLAEAQYLQRKGRTAEATEKARAAAAAEPGSAEARALLAALTGAKAPPPPRTAPAPDDDMESNTP